MKAADAAWAVADAAIAAAYDIAVADMLAEFREKFPQVRALRGVYVEPECGALHFGFDAVLIKDTWRPETSIKPENAEAIRVLLYSHLAGRDLPGHIQDALDRFVSDDGALWADRTEPFVSAEAPA